MRTILFILSLFVMIGCENSPKADLVILNGNIYTVDENQPLVEAVAVTGNKISYVGEEKGAKKLIGDQTSVIDLQGKTMTPGLIESHAHFLGIGYSKMNLDMLYITSYEELVSMVEDAVKKAEPGEWITGRGWHQSKWDSISGENIKGFPTHHMLSAVSPDNPVWLSHASGHAGFTNAKAMEIAGVDKNTVFEEGGEIIKDENGNPTGIFNESAGGLITRYLPEQDESSDRKAFSLAMEECLKEGIVGFHDAGVKRETIDLYKEKLDKGEMKLRMYGMLGGYDKTLLNEFYEKGPEIGLGNHFLTLRSIKLFCDGALGSRGAWLLEPYSDRPDHIGHSTGDTEYIYQTSVEALKNGFQVCIHAIGDRANREVLNQYERAMQEVPGVSEHRFRIEHAQHLSKEDIPRFSELGIIASMQAIHMSSDRPWAIKRLGEERILEGAYVWQKLLNTGAVIINGTDAPVEPVSAINCFYASVSRRTLKGNPPGGFEPDQKMTREQALRSYTLDAAYGSFEEDIKGSIEVGKLADFTIFSNDIMTIPEDDILDLEVMMTVIDGKVVYKK
ncbi:amidohydrolase [Bacteroidota bacterium]